MVFRVELLTTRIPMELMACLGPMGDLGILGNQDSVEAMGSKVMEQALQSTQLGREKLTMMITINPEDLTTILCINLQGAESSKAIWNSLELTIVIEFSFKCSFVQRFKLKMFKWNFIASLGSSFSCLVLLFVSFYMGRAFDFLL